MGTRKYTIRVPAPIGEVYYFLKDFNPKNLNYGCALAGDIVNIAQQSDGTLLELEIQDQPIKYVANIIERVPNAKIVWKSIDGSLNNRGELTFQEAGPGKTNIAAVIEYDGPDAETVVWEWNMFPEGHFPPNIRPKPP